ncbi:hypothetical protein J9303_19865, partial [Bacillaceae bacterium Marseille-Q3522]|nr:hypothetical protein [Bacillaceae bacterium Marseille-Q3522]
MSIALGKDEVVKKSEHFTSNLVLAWLKTSFSLTNKRIIGNEPNTVFGLIPLGVKEVTYPLKNVASVSVSTKFHFKRFVLGIILILLGLSTMGSSFFWGLILLLLGAIPFLN